MKSPKHSFHKCLLKRYRSLSFSGNACRKYSLCDYFSFRWRNTGFKLNWHYYGDVKKRMKSSQLFLNKKDVTHYLAPGLGGETSSSSKEDIVRESSSSSQLSSFCHKKNHGSMRKYKQYSACYIFYASFVCNNQIHLIVTFRSGIQSFHVKSTSL